MGFSWRCGSTATIHESGRYCHLLETNDEDITGSSLRKACLNIRKAIDDVATFPHHLKKIPRLLVEKSETIGDAA